MKCVLVHLPISQAPTPPSSLAYLKSSLLNHGVACKTIDFASRARGASPYLNGNLAAEKEILENTSLLEQWRDEILSSSSDFICFLVSTSNMKLSHKMTEMIRELTPGVSVVSTGKAFESGNLPRIKNGLEFSDCVIQGDAETVLPQVVDVSQRSGEFHIVKQVWTRGSDGQPIFSGTSPLPKIDDSLLPNFEDFDLGSYPEKNRLPLLFSKGGLTRSAQSVYRELIYLIDHYKIEGYLVSTFSDTTMPSLEEFCDLTASNKQFLPWGIQRIKLDSALNPALVKKLARANLQQVMLEIKPHKFVEQAIQCFANEGISVSGHLTYGGANEGEEEFEAAYNWLAIHGAALSQLWIEPYLLNDTWADLHTEKTTEKTTETITLFGNEPWAWYSEHSNIEIKKVRFLQLVRLLEELRVKHPALSYGIGDPYGFSFIQKWDDSISSSLKSVWDGLDFDRHSMMRKWFRTGQK